MIHQQPGYFNTGHSFRKAYHEEDPTNRENL
jgi:hypothetical protein